MQARAGKENVVAELGMKGLCENPACWGIPQQIVTGYAQFGEHGGQAVSGMQFILGYTYAKCLSDSDSTFVGEGTSIQNGHDATNQRGLCTQDFRQRLTLSFLYDLPFGKGRRFLSSMSRVNDAILGGWQVNGIYTARTGSPYTAIQSGDFPNVGDGSARLDLI